METLSYKIRERQIELIDIQSIRKLERQYLNYVSNHVDNVNKAWEQMKANKNCIEIIKTAKIPGKVDCDLTIFLAGMDVQIRVHDNSKYKDDEWDGYRKNFYPIDEAEKKANESDFQLAWKHHYEHNMHHWDYWYHSNLMNEMPLSFVIEMCCDWIAMSMKFGGTVDKWYEGEKKKIHLGKAQEDVVVRLLKAFYK